MGDHHCAERQVAKLVQNHEVGARQALGDLPGLALRLLLLERVDELDRGEEADLLSMVLDGLDAESGHDVIVYRERKAFFDVMRRSGRGSRDGRRGRFRERYIARR
jgi:hypothetical protein